MVPEDLRYSKEHEWARVEGEEAVIGITDHAQSELGDVVFVELPAVGTTINQFETFGVVESVKAASDLYSPLGGEVVAVNDTLTDQPELVNSSPYDQGWMIRVRLRDKAELDQLLDAAGYRSLIG
jgi:glycine cleavage system H protein